MTENTCYRCGQTKPIKHFGLTRRKVHKNICWQCEYQDAKRRRASKPVDPQESERIAEQRRLYHIKNREIRNAASRARMSVYQKMLRVRFPVKHQARRLLNHALEAGKIIRPHYCQHCAKEGLKLHAHHDDYARPLEVIWLCHPCHGRLHRRMRAMGISVKNAEATFLEVSNDAECGEVS